MSVSSGEPWIGSPIANLSLSDPRCKNDSCHAFYDAHQLSQKLVSYSYQYLYGHFTTWYYLAWLGVFAAAYLFNRTIEFREDSTRNEHKPNNVRRLSSGSANQISLWKRSLAKVTAAWRFCSYRHVPGWWSDTFGVPSAGMLSFLILAILYLSILTFLERPYYRQHRGYGSPPLAVRTGLMATALTPLTIALSGKANLITLLTGIGHERLNVIHRWVGWIIFALSVVHTIPFIVAPLKDGGPSALYKQFYKKGGFEYTGAPPLAMLFGLLVLSIPWIRHRAYEGFYHLHFWLAVTYLGTLFWHAGMEGDSWDYLWATLAIWLATILARAFWFTRPTNIMQTSWFGGSSVSALRTFPNSMTKLEILVPPAFRWSPGQHVFLRFPAISPFDNHPFTIASADMAPSSSEQETERRTLAFYVRSHMGFTKRIRKHINGLADPQLEAWVEGPYGGMHQAPGKRYDQIMLVMGGGGISAGLPWIEHFARMFEQGFVDTKVKNVRLVWSVRERESIHWVEQALIKLPWTRLGKRITLYVHVTGEALKVEGRPEEAQKGGDWSSSAGKDLEKEVGFDHGKTIGNEILLDGPDMDGKGSDVQLAIGQGVSQEEENIDVSEVNRIKDRLPIIYHNGRINFARLLSDCSAVPPSSRTLILGMWNFIFNPQSFLSSSNTSHVFQCFSFLSNPDTSIPAYSPCLYLNISTVAPFPNFSMSNIHSTSNHNKGPGTN
ncbi:MAG: hypothetical protein Q9227_009247 [Pyrenula ochraceoflavens]